MNMKKIAELSGVSISTVSKILNNKDDSISKETRERVLDIARKYNYARYTPSIISSSKTWLIGIIIKSHMTTGITISGMIENAQAAGYHTIVCETNGDINEELKNITALCRYKVDGILWEPIGEESTAHEKILNENNIPYLLFHDPKSKENIVDFKKLGYYATDILVQKRHTNIACLISKGKRTEAFLKGYQDCLFEHNIAVSKKLIYETVDENLIKNINNHSISGIVSSHFSGALSFFEKISSLHYQIPYDVSLVSLKDDSRKLVTFPHISTLTIPNKKFGAFLCKKIIAIIEKDSDFNEVFSPEITLDNTTTIDIPFNLKPKHLIVIGSLNVDTYLNVNTIPGAGKTISASTSSIYPGGKAINQAVGVARLGHTVSVIGNVGSDLESNLIYDAIKQHNINPVGIKRCNNSHTGKAYIFLQPDGQSLISILSGANSTLSPEDIDSKKLLFENTGYCLVQTEIPPQTVLKALQTAHANGASTILNPSACSRLSKEILEETDILVTSTDELLDLCPANNNTFDSQIHYLTENQINYIVIALEGRKYYIKSPDWEETLTLPTMPSVDTTGMCDAFISALASYLMYGYSFQSSVRIALFAASFSATREGVLPALISKISLESYIRQTDPNLLAKK